jgi:hypothetical protein
MPATPDMVGSIGRRIVVLASLGKKARFYLKNTQCKKGWSKAPA